MPGSLQSFCVRASSVHDIDTNCSSLNSWYTAPKHISLQRDNYIVTKQQTFWHTRLEFKPKEVTMKISAMCIMRFDRETPEPVLLHICHDVSEHGWFQRSTYALRAPSAYPPLPYPRCSNSSSV